MLAADEPPSYERAPKGSKLDRFDAVIRKTLEDWPEIKAALIEGRARPDPGVDVASGIAFSSAGLISALGALRTA